MAVSSELLTAGTTLFQVLSDNLGFSMGLRQPRITFLFVRLVLRIVLWRGLRPPIGILFVRG